MRARWASSIAATSRAWLGGPGSRVEQREHVGDQDPARRRRRVGEDVVAAVADADRLARDRLVGGEVGEREHPAALGDAARRRLGDVAGVERRRALRAEALERVGQLGVAQHVALARDVVADPVLRARLRARRGDRREQVEDVGLLRVDLDARARERRGRARRGRRAGPSRSAGAPRRSRPACRRRRTPRRRRGRPARRPRRTPRPRRAARAPTGRRPRRARRRRSRAAPARRPARPRACSRRRPAR